MTDELLPPPAMTTIPPEPDPPQPRVEVLEEGYREVRVVLGGAAQPVTVRVFRRQTPSGTWHEPRVLVQGARTHEVFSLERWREVVAGVELAIGEFAARFGP